MSQPILGEACPWPGPKPYEEEDAEFFFGRRNEIRELISSHVGANRLTILISGSGSGKTSLLQAGLVPALRYKRSREGDNPKTGVVLMLRKWGDLPQARPAQMVVRAIEKEILRLSNVPSQIVGSDRLSRDIAALKRVEPPDNDNISCGADVVHYLTKLCDCKDIGALIIIFDQAEELLGSTAGRLNIKTESEALDILGDIFEYEPRVNPIISLREEYESRLRRLDSRVPDLALRKYYLEPMKHETIKSVIAESSSSSKYLDRIKDGVIERILEYADEGKEDTASGIEELQPPELLNIQALLIELFKYAIANNRRTIGHLELNDLEDKLGAKGKILLNMALQRYIEGLFEESPSPDTESHQADFRAPGVELMKYVTCGYAWHLSSPGGFKRRVDGAELLESAIGEELLTLSECVQRKRGSHIYDRKYLLRYLSDMIANQETNMEPLLSFLFGENESAKVERDLRSGIARENYWTLKQTATHLCRTALASIDMLTTNGVLKTGVQEGGDRIYELSHDGFGPVFVTWADQRSQSPQDTVSSVVAWRGVNFDWNSLKPEDFGLSPNSRKELRGLCWLGCNLVDKDLLNVDFFNCDLSGLIFVRCMLKNCSFHNCDLKGTIFTEGSWDNVTWDRCRAPSLLLTRGLKWNGVTIESSVLDQITVDNITLTGNNTIYDSSLCLGTIKRVTSKDGSKDGRMIARNCDFYNTKFEHWDENIWILDNEWKDFFANNKVPESRYPSKGPIGCRTMISQID